jgi:Right handed beta helix region
MSQRDASAVPALGRPGYASVLQTIATVTFVFVAILVAPVTHRALGLTTSCKGVSVRPGQNLQAIIDAHAAGTRFCLRRGTYFISSPLTPKRGQRFVAVERRTAVLTGRDKPGSFAFNGAGAPGVWIKGLVVRDFVPPDAGGYAAIKGDRRWRVIDNRIGPNKNTGLYHEAHSVVRGNLIKGNTVAGIGGFMAHGSLIENNVIARNGRSHVDGRAAGAKWTRSKGIIVRGNYFHHNWENALWLDIDNLDPIVANNTVTMNFGRGIHYEISCAAVIRRNVVRWNAGAGILVVASRGVRIYRNVVSRNGDGIQVSHQDRTAENHPGDNCRWVTGRVSIHDNKVTMGRGSTGLWKWQVADGDLIFSDGRVRFYRNHYRVDAGAERPFLWANASRTWSRWRSYGQDLSGTFRRI